MTSKADGTHESGFSLIEVVLCVALLTAGAVAALGTVPSLMRASQEDLLRSAAADIGRNAVERVRAATAYYPSTGGVGDVSATPGHTWAFVSSASITYVAAAHIHRTWCGATSPAIDVAMPVTMTYDAPADTIHVTVAYPIDPCNAQIQRSVSLSMPLAASQWSPETQLPSTISEPALQ